MPFKINSSNLCERLHSGTMFWKHFAFDLKIIPSGVARVTPLGGKKGWGQRRREQKWCDLDEGRGGARNFPTRG